MTGQHVHIDGHLLSEVADILTDLEPPGPMPRWTVHPAPAPVGTQPPFIALSYDAPTLSGGSVAVESWGRLDQTVRCACFGVSLSQAEWLRVRVLEAPWPEGWRPDPIIEPAFVDDTDAPPWWVATIRMRHTG